MASNFIARDEFERRFSNLTGYVDHSIDQLKGAFINELRASELRTQEKIQDSEGRLRVEFQDVRMELKADLQAFRERHDVELAQVHEELGRINEMLLYIVQRLPIQPIQPPPAQFLSHEK